MPTIRLPSRPRPAASRVPSALAALLAAALLAGGCATTGTAEEDAPFELSEDYADGVVSYTVQRGDRLGDIALEFTGELSRWRDIAASNGIDDPRDLRAGAVLRIPAELIPGYADALAARRADTPEEAVPVVATAPAEPRRVAVPDERPAVVTGLATRGRAQPVELSPVDVNRRFQLAPLDGETPPAGTASEPDARVDDTGVDASDTRRVKVVGSYFPKGIYAQPAVYSKLLMRVAPGTLFELDGEVGDWYGVVTPDGVGYLRDSDGRIVDDEIGALTASNALRG